MSAQQIWCITNWVKKCFVCDCCLHHVTVYPHSFRYYCSVVLRPPMLTGFIVERCGDVFRVYWWVAYSIDVKDMKRCANTLYEDVCGSKEICLCLGSRTVNAIGALYSVDFSLYSIWVAGEESVDSYNKCGGSGRFCYELYDFSRNCSDKRLYTN